MPRYAQIDANGVCIGISSLSGEVDAPNLIPLQPDQSPTGQRWQNGEWVDEPQPEPEQQPSTPVLYAAAQLQIVDYDVTGIEINSKLGGAFWADTGKYIVFFAETQPDTSYMVQASAGPLNAYVLPADKLEDFFTVTVTDAAGQPAEADFVNLSIVRAM